MSARCGIIALVLMSPGCAAAVDADVPVHGSTGARCDAKAAQALLGRPATAALAAEAQRLSGAGTVRWLHPGQIITMEYREDRLNIELDAQNRVAAIRCG